MLVKTKNVPMPLLAPILYIRPIPLLFKFSYHYYQNKVSDDEILSQMRNIMETA